MARHWSGGEEPPDQDEPDQTAAADPVDERPDPISNDAESERDDEPADAHPKRPRERARLTDRLGTVARRAATGLVTAVIARLPAAQAALLPRLTRLICAVVGGLLLCASFPTLNWWWAAVIAAALLAWVLTHPATTPAGGLGYAFLFGLAFYLPLLPWVGLLVGSVPWVALSAVSALFPAAFGLCAVVVRRLPAWPIWFALLWAAQEWLKSVFPFGGFPWGSVAFGQTHGPFLPLVQLGGVALLSMAIMLVVSARPPSRGRS